MRLGLLDLEPCAPLLAPSTPATRLIEKCALSPATPRRDPRGSLTAVASSFRERLERLAAERRSVLCVGLDPRPELFPAEVFRGVRDGPAGLARALERFCTGIVEAVAEHAVAVKPQLAFFEQAGHHGLAAAERVAEFARERGLLVIADGKRGDIGSTAEAYAAAYLAPRRGAPPFADALTVNPYLGADSLEPFAEACRASGGLAFVLVRTSNPAAPISRSWSSPTARASGSASRASWPRSLRWRAPWSAQRNREPSPAHAS